MEQQLDKKLLYRVQLMLLVVSLLFFLRVLVYVGLRATPSFPASGSSVEVVQGEGDPDDAFWEEIEQLEQILRERGWIVS